jgi:hypothetical protein
MLLAPPMMMTASSLLRSGQATGMEVTSPKRAPDFTLDRTWVSPDKLLLRWKDRSQSILSETISTLLKGKLGSGRAGTPPWIEGSWRSRTSKAGAATILIAGIGATGQLVKDSGYSLDLSREKLL